MAYELNFAAAAALLEDEDAAVSFWIEKAVNCESELHSINAITHALRIAKSPVVKRWLLAAKKEWERKH